MEKIFRISSEMIVRANREWSREAERDYAELGRRLRRRGVEIDEVRQKLEQFQVSLPSWGLSTGGTRFGRFPGPGEPRDIYERLADAACVHALTGVTPWVSLHIPWDKTEDPGALRNFAKKLGLAFDTMNSNTFQDQADQALSYKFGSLSHTWRAVRDQAIAHHREVIAFGEKAGAKALNIWIGDGANYPGQVSLSASFERYVESLKKIYRSLPGSWRLFIEYKPFEPAFYYTVLADWGSALMAAQEVGERCQVLVDTGHHLPGTNLEAIVVRLIRAGKLGGFHLNDSHYADDDLTAGSISPYRLFRVFHELVLAGRKNGKKFRPAHMIDQSHNLKDPIEDLCQTVMEMQNLWAKALLVDHERLAEYQEKNDVVMAELCMKEAFHTDTRPLAALARKHLGGAISPISTYRDSGYREKKARERRA